MDSENLGRTFGVILDILLINLSVEEADIYSESLLHMGTCAVYAWVTAQKLCHTLLGQVFGSFLTFN